MTDDARAEGVSRLPVALAVLLIVANAGYLASQGHLWVIPVVGFLLLGTVWAYANIARFGGRYNGA